MRDPKHAEGVIASGQLDLVMLLPKAFLSDPRWAYHSARTLGRPAPESRLPDPYAFSLKGP